MTRAKVPIAVFVSGRGRTLVNLAAQIEAGALPARIALVVGSKACDATTWAIERRIATEIAPRLAVEDVERLVREHGVHWIVLAGYIKHLPIPTSMRGRIVNIHPALLPKFGGKGMYGHRVHQAVLDSCETESGCTVHYVDDVYDHGDVIAQVRCAVEAGDTPETLAARVFALECALYPRVLAELFAEKALGTRDQALG
ncbi:MAG: phosphoribosylglycinamide formyltransferase [Phycisphaerales bacterium]|nr:phosphoribosylglycinamide formyltransferase [Phycisphaerales bacterium]